MNNNFPENEKLYRAVYPPEKNPMFWKDETHVSSAVFLDKKGLSVERGNFRTDEEVLKNMKKKFIGRIIYISVNTCNKVKAKILYKPTKKSIFHSEIHGSEKRVVLSPAQRRFLSMNCKQIVSS